MADTFSVLDTCFHLNDKCPTPALLQVLLELVFDPAELPLRLQTQSVREAATLSLGAVTKSLVRCDPTQAEDIAARLAEWLYNGGPQYHPDARRSLKQLDEDHRLVVISALGNTRLESIKHHIVAHADAHSTAPKNDTDMYTHESTNMRHGLFVCLSVSTSPSNVPR